MTTVNGTIPVALDQAPAEVRRVAAVQGWALVEGGGGPGVLVFKRGAKLWSWGTQITVQLIGDGEGRTAMTVITHESFALTDWGRGRRAAHKLITALGAPPQ